MALVRLFTLLNLPRPISEIILDYHHTGDKEVKKLAVSLVTFNIDRRQGKYGVDYDDYGDYETTDRKMRSWSEVKYFICEDYFSDCRGDKFEYRMELTFIKNGPNIFKRRMPSNDIEEWIGVSKIDWVTRDFNLDDRYFEKKRKEFLALSKKKRKIMPS